MYWHPVRSLTRMIAARRLLLAGFAGALALSAGSALAGFENSGDMIVPRTYHSATLLADGRVLIAGGIKPAVDRAPTPDAEIYDPATGRFSATGNMQEARADNVAALLPDGRVLIVGGWGGGDIHANGELYDPASGTFEPVVSAFEVGGERSSIVVLTDGRALIVGGFNMGARSAAWLFDSTKNTFVPTGGLADGRYAHTLTRLADGRVLVAGGLTSGGGPRDDAEIYDPASGTFQALTARMSVARERHAATLLADGRVLIAGGYTWEGEQLDTAELFDPATGTFIPSQSTMALPRVEFHLVPLDDGSVLTVGSYQFGQLTATAELYHAATDSFSLIQPGPSTERNSFAATRLADGRVLLTGGVDLMDPEGNLVVTAELYTPEGNDAVFANGFEP